MNRTPVVIFLFVAFGNIPPAWTDDSARCYSIRDSDQRNACLAYTRDSKGRCYSIKDADRKQLCLAQVTGERSRCHNVRAPDLRNACLAGVGWQ